MTEGKKYRSLGLMSGTSLDGVDAALIETDGETIFEFGNYLTITYEPDVKSALHEILGKDKASAGLIREFTEIQARAVSALLAESAFGPADIDVIGFHGQTILHDPDQGRTVQIGDGEMLARLTGIDVVNDFRSNDMAEGGQGAPFAPVYHRSLTGGMAKPLAVLNIGGVANVTWIGEEEMLAFDTGPGNALMDDWVKRRTGEDFDFDGAMARSGSADLAVLQSLMDNVYFSKEPPKSLDRNDFSVTAIDGMTVENGVATLAAFTVESIARAQDFFPQPVDSWIVCGGGRRNAQLMVLLKERLAQKVMLSEDAGWRGDAIEAQAFAFMAVRSLLQKPISFPGTTGVAIPMPGGKLNPAPAGD